MRPQVNSHGFTLIEILIALTVSGLLLALLSQSFFMITRQWESRFEVQVAAINQARQQNLMEVSLGAMVPLVETDEDAVSQRLPLFEGGRERVAWATARPVFFEGLALATLEKTTIDGQLRWVYSESPLSGFFGAPEGANSDDSQISQLLLWPAQNQYLRYLGYPGLDVRLERVDGERPVPVWADSFSGRATGQLPRSVSILEGQPGAVVSTVTVRHSHFGYLRGAE